MAEDWKDKLEKLKNNNPRSQKYGGGAMPEKIVFLDDNGIIKPELLDSRASEWAESFIRPPSEGRDTNKGLTSAQLRRFYNDAKALEVKLRVRKNFKEIWPLIKLMKSKVAYACPEKGKKKVPTEFKEFIYTMVDSINNEKDFQAFLLCFEAVVGYFYGQGGRQQ